MSVVEIREPFYSAGKKFGWPGASAGIGVMARLCRGEGILRVRVLSASDTVYWIEKWRAREIVRRYRSFHMAKSTKLAVIPWNEFTAEVISKEDGE
jgi:hypothetical protein